ncbi:MAG TPA: spore cortex biosynthesis protein YabQ [Chondromyces sp.]|nr:spore cortex biosynthesis protein YabQ [Chondromyces sp.]
MSLTVQFYTMLAMLAMGSFFGATLDTYNRFLKRSMRARWICFINDLLFWSLQGLLIFYILFLVNYGEIRFYIFIALLCGFSAYQALIKSLYLKILESAIELAINIYLFMKKLLYHLVYRPVRGIWKILIITITNVGRSLLSLAKLLLKLLLLVGKVILTPFGWVLKWIWRILPKQLKVRVEKNYVYVKGFFEVFKNKVIKLIAKFKKFKK